MKKLFFFIPLFISAFAYSQNRDTLKTGTVTIIQDTAISYLIWKHSSFPEGKFTMPGYRIQISSNNNRKIIMDDKILFLQYFPDVHAYMTYQQPYFKLRVGDFIEKEDAFNFLKEVRDDFSNAFIVQEEIIVNEETLLNAEK